MEPFVKKAEDNKPTLLYLSKWNEEYRHLSVGFTTRLGGMSHGDFTSLNCALHVNDNKDDVVVNRKLVAETIGFSYDSVTCANQVHGDQVGVITNSEIGKGRFSHEDAINSKDALITNEPNVCLISFYADCVPLYLFDPVHSVVGLAHAGWKGTYLEIAEKTIKKMTEIYESKPEHILAAIGPSIGGCCYEVDDHVFKRFENKYNDHYSMHQKEDGKYMLDLKEINRQILIKAGISSTHISTSKYCTGCNTDLFYSHRIEKGSTGRMMSWIGLKRS
ncbi:peptidoglycan editing factor PgeF [Chengkuizengella axinellae]|uniref:Purine nucleoside phosphorylase n=1 Tax=Chengkuizengella axinellae TaxID=3064388 RepID=A0ABT9IUZ0_9BACL|nr:peptidoglycan editing factor PgeF [Chengkuizengella sp. 2205SS18-9]MDP5273166.1 peptidoglycan editing factor PgeF [Chengkuizengella sp. 2205SS18-9]